MFRSKLGESIERVPEVAEQDEAEERKAHEEREDPQQECDVPNVSAVFADLSHA